MKQIAAIIVYWIVAGGLLFAGLLYGTRQDVWYAGDWDYNRAEKIMED